MTLVTLVRIEAVASRLARYCWSEISNHNGTDGTLNCHNKLVLRGSMNSFSDVCQCNAESQLN